MAEAKHPIHGEISGPIVMIGYGSIGRGTLPLIERHFSFDRSRLVVVDPCENLEALSDAGGIRHVRTALTPDNYRTVLEPLLSEGSGR